MLQERYIAVTTAAGVIPNSWFSLSPPSQGTLLAAQMST